MKPQSVTSLVSGLFKDKPHLRKLMEEEVIRGASEDSHQENILSEEDTQRMKYQSSLEKIETIGGSDPRLLLATQRECYNSLMSVSYAKGKELNKERAIMLTKHMMSLNLTLAELDACESAIITDADLTKELSYQQSVTPAIYDMARKHPKVRKVRLLTRAEAMDIFNNTPEPRGNMNDMFSVVRDSDNNLYYISR